jgi:peptide-methionine (R)-S-oxide reductase
MIDKPEEEWKKELTPEQYRVLREKGTEAPYTGKYNLHFEKGVYTCGACGTGLFSSDGKYDAGCGWPSFHTPIDNDVIETKQDFSHGMVRTEILCKNCGGHLGHVFTDGPQPTGVRFCVNSLSLDFKKEN